MPRFAFVILRCKRLRAILAIKRALTLSFAKVTKPNIWVGLSMLIHAYVLPNSSFSYSNASFAKKIVKIGISTREWCTIGCDFSSVWSHYGITFKDKLYICFECKVTTL